MKRVPRIVHDRLEVELTELTPLDAQELERALDRFRTSTKHHVESMVALIAEDIASRHVRADTLERLSKWCNSDGTFSSAVDPARKVALLLLGACPERLIGEDGAAVADYSERIGRFKLRVDSSEA